MDPDGPKTCGSCGSGSGSPTLEIPFLLAVNMMYRNMSDIRGCTGGLLQAEETVADELGVQLDGLLLQALIHVQVGCVQHLHHKINIKSKI